MLNIPSSIRTLVFHAVIGRSFSQLRWLASWPLTFPSDSFLVLLFLVLLGSVIFLLPQNSCPEHLYSSFAGSGNFSYFLVVLLSAHLPATLRILLAACLPASQFTSQSTCACESPLVITCLDFVLHLQPQESVTFETLTGFVNN